MKTNYLQKIVFSTVLITTSLCSYAQILPDGIYVINNINLEEVITVDQTPEADARMAAPDVEGDNLFQQWDFVHQGNDIYNITNVGSGALLGVRDRWCGDFGDVRAIAGADDGFDLRVVNADASGTFSIEIAYDNECNFGSVNDPIKAFDVQNGASGAEIQTFPRDPSNANQQFEITPPVPAAVLSVDELSLENTSEVFYNASTGLVVKNNQNQNINIHIFNTSGSNVYSYSNIEADNTVTLNLDSFHAGMYFVQTTTKANQNTVTKIIVD